MAAGAALGVKVSGGRAPGLALLGLWLAVGAWLVPEAVRQFAAGTQALEARHALARWTTGRLPAPDRAQWSQALEDLTDAASHTPDNGDLMEALGTLHMLEPAAPDESDAERRARYARSAEAYRRSLAVRPASAATWAALALAHAGMEEGGAPLNEAWARARALGPNETYLHEALLRATLATWQQASSPMQQWAQELFEGGDTRNQAEFNKLAADYGLRFQVQGPVRSPAEPADPGPSPAPVATRAAPPG